MNFTDATIQELYDTKVKLPASYFKKYEKLPPCPREFHKYTWYTNDFPRNWCILDFIEWIEKHNLKHVDHLGHTYDDPELEFLTYDKATYLSYPGHDLHTISKNFKEEFDFFVFNHTLEHLYNPFQAVSEIFKIVKPGGYVFTSVPTMNIPHGIPFHYNGFTPMGLAMLFKTAGFEVVEMGQWGNYEYIQKLWGTHGWPGYRDLQRDGVIVNEEANVCQCWILAKKPIT